MDLWVVAAAAGAGYLAKHWQNLLRENKGSPESFSGGSIQGTPESRPFLQHFRERSCPFDGLARRQLCEASDKEEVSDCNFSKMADLDGVSSTSVITARGFDSEALVNLGKYEDYNNQLSISSLPAEVSRIQDLQENCDGINDTSKFGYKSCDILSETSIGDTISLYRTIQIRSSLRSKRSEVYSVKPLSSLESCLIAQMYREHTEMEEYVLGSIPSPSKPAARPLFVTDGNWIISRASSYFSALFNRKGNRLNRKDEFHSVKYETLLGIPPLPEIGSEEPPRNTKQNTAKGQLGGLSSSGTKASGKDFSQGPPDGRLLILIGISIGVISTAVEMDKVKQKLKQKDNLIQDLQEELEMKDSLIVKELPAEVYESQETNEHSFPNRASNVADESYKFQKANEGYESQESHEHSFPNMSSNVTDESYKSQKANEHSFPNLASKAWSPEQEVDEFAKYSDKKQGYQKEKENSESRSKAEAELEDELERMGLIVKTSSPEERLSNLVELDPDFEADIVHGELRADMVSRREGVQAEVERDASGTTSTQTHTAIYPVSPRDLTLRLHEVIRSRLEDRIMELESALQYSQKKMHLMEAEHVNFKRDSSNGKVESSAQESPHSVQESNGISQPLVLNRCGEALDGYDEVYEEFMRITEMEEEVPPSMLYNGNQVSKESPYLGQNVGTNGNINKERESRNLVHDKVKRWEDWISRSQSSSEGGESEDEDEVEITKQLIKKIVEKSRQGSPVVLNVQRMLFSLDEKQASE